MKSSKKLIIGALIGIGAFATALVALKIIRSLDELDELELDEEEDFFDEDYDL